MRLKVRLAALMLALMLALGGSLVSCRETEKSGAVMTLGEHTVDEGYYRFLYATYKARYLALYDGARDAADFWRADHGDGETNAEWMDSLVRDVIRMLLSAEAIFDERGLTLDDETHRKNGDYIDDLIYERFDGDGDKFDEALAALGADRDSLMRKLDGEAKMTALFDHYFGTNGVRKLTDEDLEEYYAANYVRFGQINVNDAYVYVEEDGHYVQNADGSYATRALTDAERASKDAVIAEVDSRLAAGEDFDALYAGFSENTSYPHGYYFSADTAADYDADIVAAAFALAEGEWTKLHTAHGTFWIKRLPLDEGGFALDETADFFGGFQTAVKNSLFDRILKAEYPKIAEDADKVNALSVTSVAANYDLD